MFIDQRTRTHNDIILHSREFAILLAKYVMNINQSASKNERKQHSWNE